MKQKRKCSAKDMLERLRGREVKVNIENEVQPQHQQSNNNQSNPSLIPNEVQPQQNVSMANNPQQHVNMTSSPSHEGTFDHDDPSLIPNEVQPQQKEAPLLVKVIDTCTRECINRKMVATEVWNLEKNKKVIVELNGYGQGNDDGSNLLVRFLGQVAKKSAYCTISVERWDQMPEERSIEQWQCIEKHFEFDYAAGIKWVRSTLGERWKSYKYRLRNAYFYPKKSKEEILAAKRPDDVGPVEWAAFVHHYKDEKMKKQSEQNTNNRKKLKVSHAGGSKRNARKGRQMEKKLGRSVCRSEVVLSNLFKKDGNYLNDEGQALANSVNCLFNKIQVWVWGFLPLMLLESAGISQILFKLAALIKRMLKT